MTAEELKQRGYCCGLGCTECPYRPKHQYGNTILADIFQKESTIINFENIVLKEINK